MSETIQERIEHIDGLMEALIRAARHGTPGDVMDARSDLGRFMMNRLPSVTTPHPDTECGKCDAVALRATALVDGFEEEDPSVPDTGDTAALDELLDTYYNRRFMREVYCEQADEDDTNALKEAREAIDQHVAAIVQAERGRTEQANARLVWLLKEGHYCEEEEADGGRRWMAWDVHEEPARSSYANTPAKAIDCAMNLPIPSDNTP